MPHPVQQGAIDKGRNSVDYLCFMFQPEENLYILDGSWGPKPILDSNKFVPIVIFSSSSESTTCPSSQQVIHSHISRLTNKVRQLFRERNVTVARVPAAALAAVSQIAAWRDGLARRHDESHHYIMPDSVAVELALTQPEAWEAPDSLRRAILLSDKASREGHAAGRRLFSYDAGSDGALVRTASGNGAVAGAGPRSGQSSGTGGAANGGDPRGAPAEGIARYRYEYDLSTALRPDSLAELVDRLSDIKPEGGRQATQAAQAGSPSPSALSARRAFA